jgi:hypothetical protein
LLEERPQLKFRRAVQSAFWRPQTLAPCQADGQILEAHETLSEKEHIARKLSTATLDVNTVGGSEVTPKIATRRIHGEHDIVDFYECKL